MTGTQNFWKSRKAVGVWLLSMAAVIMGMVTIGGLTRLTGSGLSITEWDPIMGVIPPLSDMDWADAFAKYQRIPQYIIENQGMSLEQFQDIFWWEWTHRFGGGCWGVVRGAVRLVRLGRRDQEKRLAAHGAAVRAGRAAGFHRLVGWWKAGWRRGSRSASTGWRSIGAPRSFCWGRFYGSRWNISKARNRSPSRRDPPMP